MEIELHWWFQMLVRKVNKVVELDDLSMLSNDM
jgi:hypothetical protein